MRGSSKHDLSFILPQRRFSIRFWNLSTISIIFAAFILRNVAGLQGTYSQSSLKEVRDFLVSINKTVSLLLKYEPL